MKKQAKPIVFPVAMSDYLARLVCVQKRDYALALATAIANGTERPVSVAKWAPDCTVKVVRYMKHYQQPPALKSVKAA